MSSGGGQIFAAPASSGARAAVVRVLRAQVTRGSRAALAAGVSWAWMAGVAGRVMRRAVSRVVVPVSCSQVVRARRPSAAEVGGQRCAGGGCGWPRRRRPRRTEASSRRRRAPSALNCLGCLGDAGDVQPGGVGASCPHPYLVIQESESVVGPLRW